MAGVFGRIHGRAEANDIRPTRPAATAAVLQAVQGRLAMTNVPLAGIKACVFDAYGTLFDFAAAARGCRDVLGAEADKLTALWRDKQLQYTWLRSLSGRYADFWQVTGEALDFTLETLGIDRPGLRDRLMTLYLTLETFPEVPDVLRRLKESGMRTAILSNGSPRMLDAIVTGNKLASLIDAVLSVDEVGVYKTHPTVYQLAVDRLGVPAGRIAFQSSNAWDAYAASAFGMRVVWCNRYGQRRERLPGGPDCEVKSLAELPALVGIA
jgi:2-haloacid dehalogenase